MRVGEAGKTVEYLLYICIYLNSEQYCGAAELRNDALHLRNKQSKFSRFHVLNHSN